MTLASASPSFALLSPLFDEASLAVPRGGDLSGVGFAGWLFGELLVGALLVGVLVGGVSAGVAIASPGVTSAATMANARSFMTGPLVNPHWAVASGGPSRTQAISARYRLRRSLTRERDGRSGTSRGDVTSGARGPPRPRPADREISRPAWRTPV